MVGTASVAAVLGLGLAAAASVVGTPRQIPAQSPFGGPAAAHIARVGRIEVNLTSGTGVLRRVPCVGSRPATDCYLASRFATTGAPTADRSRRTI